MNATDAALGRSHWPRHMAVVVAELASDTQGECTHSDHRPSVMNPCVPQSVQRIDGVTVSLSGT